MKQSDLEAEMRDMGIKRYRDKVLRTRKFEMESQTPVGKRLLEESVSRLAKGIVGWKMRVDRVQAGSRHSALSYIEQLEPELIAALTARTVIDSISIHKRLTKTAIDVASSLEEELRCRKMAAEHPAVWKTTKQFVQHQTVRSSRRRQFRRAAELVNLEWENWPTADKVKVGIVLVELMHQCTGMIEIKTRSTILGKRETFVQATEDTLNWLKTAHYFQESVWPVYFPMIQKPAEWKDIWSGGYLTDVVTQRPLIKTRDKQHLKDLNDLPLTKPLAAINHLQNVAWRLNDDVIDVFQHCWEQDVPAGNLPTLNGRELPAKPIDIDTNKDACRQWRKAAARVHAENDANTSRRVQVGRIAWLTNKFKGNALYYPWYFDFRSRFYPLPYYLQPQGADWARSLLSFHRGCRMDDPESVRWAKIHGANCFGWDKETFEEREAWVDNNHDELVAIGRDPLQYISKWSSTDSPWAFLAFCCDYARYAELGGEHLWTSPVTVDGSSNGLQLFSLLMRDPVGAKATNVSPSDKPQDIYKQVADLAIARLEVSAAEGNDDAKKWIDFGVNRTCAKRPCMVVPYSGTLFAVRDYTRDWLWDRLRADPDNNPWKNQEIYRPCALLAQALWGAIDDVVGEAKKAMAWLQQVSNVCVEHQVPIRWTTPVGFLCKQGYETYKNKSVKTIVGEKIRQHRIRVGQGKLSKVKNRNAIVPNWIHSLDAAIGMESVYRCSQQGIDEVSTIHDAYSTLPAFMGTLHRMLPNVAVDLFSEDLMGGFLQGITPFLPRNVKLPDPPERGSLDIETVRSSQYFFN